jgi:hypothetical protein
MTTRYSPSAKTFYPFDIDYPNGVPDDVMEVPLSNFHAAMARPVGATFDFVKGKLKITKAPAIAFRDIASAHLDAARTTRDAILNRLAGIGFAAMADGDADTVQAIAAARTWLLDITTCPTVAAAQDIEALQAAVNAEYARIAATLSGEARRAFDDAGTAASQ